MKLIDELKTLLVPDSVEAKFLQLFSAVALGGLTLFIPNPLGGYGLPIAFYSPGTVTCSAISCPPPEPMFFNAVYLAVNIVFWYIIGSLILTTYRRWQMESISRNYKSIFVGALFFISASLVGLLLEPENFSLGIPTYFEKITLTCFSSVGSECSQTGGFHHFNFTLNLLWFAAGYLLFQIFGRWKN